MRRTVLGGILAAVMAFGPIAAASAQPPAGPRTLVDRIDGFLGDLFQRREAGEEPEIPAPPPVTPGTATARAGSNISTRGPAGSAEPGGRREPLPTSAVPRANTPLGVPVQGNFARQRHFPEVPTASANRRESLRSPLDMAQATRADSPAGGHGDASSTQIAAASDQAPSQTLAAPRSEGHVPLHRRLSAVRHPDLGSASPPGAPGAAGGRTDRPRGAAALRDEDLLDRTAVEVYASDVTEAMQIEEPELPTYQTASRPALAPSRPAAADPPVPSGDTAPSAPTLAPAPTSVERSQREANEVTPTLAASGGRAPRPAVETAPADRRPAVANDDRLLVTREGPILNVKTLGPARIAVGKESAYEVVMENTGTVAADEVVVQIALPEWAEVLAAEATAGATQTAEDETGTFVWRIGRLDAAARQRLVLRIVPRQSRAIDLAVRWNYTPVAVQAVIEVHEPRLEMHLTGPEEVEYGEKQLFRLELRNTGTGEAEDVVLTLMPIAPGQQPVTHPLKTLDPGDKETVDLELVPRQGGELAIEVLARCESGNEVRLAERVRVRRPELHVEAEGPALQFLGTLATYRVVVANEGDAAARDLVVTAHIPESARFMLCDDEGQTDAEETRVTWSVDVLEPGEERVYSVQCQLVAAGTNRLEVFAAAAHDLAAEAVAATRVETIADLALEVSDPPGPIPVGEPATYRVRIRNRGSETARNVEIIGYFSHGIEPVSVEGLPYRLSPGQVVFEAIERIAPGEEILLSITAEAEAAGNHIYRTEVHCRPVGIRLVSEETTHFYDGSLADRRGDAPQPRTAASPGGAGSR